MPPASPDAMTVERPWLPRHLAVPRADETLLASPDFDSVAAAAVANAGSLGACERDVQGRTLATLRSEARREAVRLAKFFTANVLGDAVADADPAQPLIVPGHQPALYHPGVWAKNFAAAGVAGRLGGTALNLIVDNDIYPPPAIDVPAGNRADPRRVAIRFDVPQPVRPWEGARVKDVAVFRTFGDRAAGQMRAWDVEPLVATYWKAAVDRFASGGSIPESLSAFRHRIEAGWGLHNLELPMSRLCETEPFLRFAAHLLAHLPKFQNVYNQSLSEYRRLHRLKSRNHPVPALEENGDWREAPFWVWRDGNPHRRRVFARQSGRELNVADDLGQVFAKLPLTPEMDACCAVEVLRTLPTQGVRFRTRALTTTLFARLFLADSFVHGIGGAKYDEMTDRIIARFFGVDPPVFAIVSASLYLPFAAPFDDAREDERRLQTLLRDLEQNPQRHLERGADPRLARLLDEKAALIAEQDAVWSFRDLSRRQRRERSAGNAARFRRLQQVTDSLATFTAGQRRHAREELLELRRRLRANRLLTSREFSFALYPENKLRPFLTQLMSL